MDGVLLNVTTSDGVHESILPIESPNDDFGRSKKPLEALFNDL
jgi:hypothetical protein